LKTKFLAVIIAFILLLNLNVCAASYEYTIATNDNFTSARSGDDMSAVAKKLNTTSDKLNVYFNENCLLYLAVSDDAKTQIRLAAFADNFSSAAGDISYLTNTQLEEFINTLSVEDENDCELIENRGRKYIVIKDSLVDSGGEYTVTQYITICADRTFYLSCYNQGDDTSDEVKEMFESFEINITQNQKNTFNYLEALILTGILLFSILSIVMIIGIVKSIKRKGTENDF